MNSNNTNKLAKVIWQLEQKDIIHEYFDVLDYGVDFILSWYGITEEWSEGDRKVLKDRLLEMAYRDEVREIRRVSEEEEDWLLSTIPEKEAPSLKVLILEHRKWKLEMAKNKENQKDSQISFCEVRK